MRFEGRPETGARESVGDEGITELSVHWRSLSVHFGAVQALAPCSGDVKVGELVALMGPTGAGKTSLLNAISKRGPCTTGVVWYGENIIWSKALKRHVAFVEQDDVVYENLTVRQTLAFSARLRLPAQTVEARDSRIHEIISLLGLQSCVDSRVGGGMNRGISGGERKRLMVCQEMLTEPRLLCCDEPTSGLDSSTAVVVVEAFRRLAFQKRVACVSAIHQPSSRIFTLFDTLVLLDKGGTVYQGPTKDAGAAFANAPFDLPCPASYSAPDWLMDCVVRGDLSTVDGPVMACRLSSEETKEAFVTKEASVKDQTAMRCDALRHRYGADSLPGPPRLRKLRVAYKNAYAAKLSEHVSVLSARAWLDVWPAFIDRNAWVLHAGEGALAGFMWYQLQYRARPRLANPQRPSFEDVWRAASGSREPAVEAYANV